MHGLSAVVVSEGYCSLQWLLLWSTGYSCKGCSSFSIWAQQLWFMSFRAWVQQFQLLLWHVASSRTRMCLLHWQVHLLIYILESVKYFKRPILDMVLNCIEFTDQFEQNDILTIQSSVYSSSIQVFIITCQKWFMVFTIHVLQS